MQLNEAIEQYGAKKRDLNKMYSAYKDGMVKLNQEKEELLIQLNESGLKSAKSANFGVAIVSRPSISVESEQSVKDWLNNTPNIESDAYIGLKLTPFKAFATSYMKETGEYIDGVEYSTTESITIRGNK